MVSPKVKQNNQSQIWQVSNMDRKKEKQRIKSIWEESPVGGTLFIMQDLSCHTFNRIVKNLSRILQKFYKGEKCWLEEYEKKTQSNGHTGVYAEKKG